jgi:cyanate lyase
LDEILQIYGMPLKDVIQDKFGDSIVSAVDFTLKVDTVECIPSYWKPV